VTWRNFRATISEKVPIKCFVKNMKAGDNVADLKGKYEEKMSISSTTE